MWYDLICLAIVAVCLWRGASKGFLWQLAGIAGIVLCFIFAETVSVAIAPMTGLQPPLSRWVSILGLYIVSSFAAFAVARTIRGGLEKAKLEDYDKHLGSLFGAIRGGLYCLVLTFFMFTISEKSREVVLHANAGYASAVVFQTISPVLPAEFISLITPYAEGFDPETISDHRHNHPQGEHVHSDLFGGQTNDANEGGRNQGVLGGPQTSDNPFLQGSGEPPQSGSTIDAQIQQMIRNLPGVISQELQQIVADSIANTAPQDRSELFEQLSTGTPGLIRQVADQWKQGKPTTTSVPQADTDWRRYRANLLQQIAGVYTEHLDAQQAIMEEVVYSLQGLPDQVTVAVLQDWQADLRGVQPDPDRSTDLRTALDQRIANQLRYANVPVQSLSRDLQERMSAVSRNYR